MTLPAFLWWFGKSPDDPSPGSPSRAGRRATRAHDLSARVSAIDDGDTPLLVRIRGADESDARAAFETMFRAYYDVLTTTAHAVLRSSDAARDVVSDVFLKLWFARAQWIPAVSARAYLIAAVRRRAWNAARDERRHEILLRNGAETPVYSDAVPVSEDEDRLRQVYAAIAAMRGVRREVMVLRWQRSLRIPEIAEALGISTNAVSAHLSQALRLLRETIGSSKAP
jgi:RNA polymerase sigma factor (sigma-70 family)